MFASASSLTSRGGALGSGELGLAKGLYCGCIEEKLLDDDELLKNKL